MCVEHPCASFGCRVLTEGHVDQTGIAFLVVDSTAIAITEVFIEGYISHPGVALVVTHPTARIHAYVVIKTDRVQGWITAAVVHAPTFMPHVNSDGNIR